MNRWSSVGHFTAAPLVAQCASYEWHHWLNELRFAVEADEVEEG